MYSACSFKYTLTNSFCVFLSFWALILFGFLLLHLDAVFTSAPFFLGLDLCLVSMHSAAVSKWALTKFSYSSFGVGVSNISCSALNLFLSVNVMHTHTHTHTHTHIYIYICVYIYISKYAYIYIYIYMKISHVYIYIYIKNPNTCKHTYIC